jgi:hypothetical protein
MPKTYEAIATYTASGTPSSYTFSSIPATYTDLVIVLNLTSTGDNAGGFQWRYNGDTGSNYSWTYFGGNGSSAFSGRNSSQTYIDTAMGTAGNPNVHILQINNYSNTTTNKTSIVRTSSSTTEVGGNVGLWRSTAAINSITFTKATNTFVNGSTFTIYGIKAA